MLEIISTLFKPHSPQLLFTGNVLSAQSGTPCRFLLRLAASPCPIPQPVRGLTLLLCPHISIPVSHAVFYTKKDLNFHLFSVSMSGTSGLIILVSNVKLRVEPPGCEKYPLRDTILGYK